MRQLNLPPQSPLHIWRERSYLMRRDQETGTDPEEDRASAAGGFGAARRPEKRLTERLAI